MSSGADVIIMDDGHQNPTLCKDLSLVVVDGGYGFGNERILPAGPLREPIETGLARASAVPVLVFDEVDSGIGGATADAVGERLARLAETQQVLVVTHSPQVAARGDHHWLLRELGAHVVAKHPFSDHYPYSEADIQPILDEAFELGAIPVTTAKDAVRLPPDQRRQVTVLTVAIAWTDERALERVLEPVMGHDR